MINIRTRVAPVNIAFSSSKNASLFERKMLQYTTLSKRLHHRTLSEMKTQVYALSYSLIVSQYIARIRNNTQTWTF